MMPATTQGTVKLVADLVKMVEKWLLSMPEEYVGRFIPVGGRWTRRRRAFPPLCHTVERLFTSRGESGCSTVEQLSWRQRRNAGDIAVEALGDLPMLLSQAMQR
jgi:hypothetical protein